MKKTVALFLCAAILCTALSGCSLLSLVMLMLENRSEVAVRPAETTAATHAPETIPVAPVEEPVSLAREYTKKYIPYQIAPDMMGTSSFDHIIQIPEINLNSEDAKRVNQEIAADCQSAIKTLDANEEGQSIYLFSYSWKLHNNMLALVMDYTMGFQSAGMSSYYEFYFFNTETGKELAYGDYLAGLGLNHTTAVETVRAAGLISDQEYPDWSLDYFIADKSGTLLYIHSKYLMEGEALFRFEEVLVK